ncbi:hypothetical protein Airi02_045860 [Actinoallomurus iriomotensis]|uniref:Uncharacterized protein n=1 Tax=Actinoallomurus iriomotensis TaxID=478107 RepID=A0A9W6S6M9_9ACTN|nr:hypothetical protein Airi02_045860 [Actinoallomurus iriomotensis]
MTNPSTTALISAGTMDTIAISVTVTIPPMRIMVPISPSRPIPGETGFRQFPYVGSR